MHIALKVVKSTYTAIQSTPGLMWLDIRYKEGSSPRPLAEFKEVKHQWRKKGWIKWTVFLMLIGASVASLLLSGFGQYIAFCVLGRNVQAWIPGVVGILLFALSILLGFTFLATWNEIADKWIYNIWVRNTFAYDVQKLKYLCQRHSISNQTDIEWLCASGADLKSYRIPLHVIQACDENMMGFAKAIYRFADPGCPAVNHLKEEIKGQFEFYRIFKIFPPNVDLRSFHHRAKVEIEGAEGSSPQGLAAQSGNIPG